MKKAALFLTSLLSLSLLLSACQPVDEKITDPRLDNFRGSSKGGKQGAAAGKLGVGFFAFSALMMEKEVEAIQLTRIALNIEEANTAGFKVDTSRADGKLTLTTDSAAKEYETEQGTFKTSLKKTFTVSVPADTTAGLLAEVVGSKATQSVDRLDRKHFINLSDASYSVKVENSPTAPAEVVITLDSNSSWMMGDDKGKTTPENLVLKVVLTVDRDSLKTSTVKVLTAQYNMNIQRTRPTSVQLAGENHQVVSNGQCYSLTGEVTILSDKSKKKLVYTDSNAEVLGASYKTSAAACESRPTVDLSRLFVY